MVNIARPRGRIEVTCPNPDCSHFGREEGKDIVKKGKNRVGHQQYYCFHCKSFFVETKGTPLYHKHLSEKEVIKICWLLVEKNSIRSIERVTGHHRDTIGRLLEDLAAHAAAVNDYLLRRVKLNEFEVDEMWATIKKQKKVKPGSPKGPHEGDAWVYNCIKRASYLHIAYAVGKWTQPTCREMLAKVSRRVSTPGVSDRLTIYSDGNDDYTYVLPEFYPIDSINYGQVVKIREKGTVVGKVKRAIYGDPNPPSHRNHQNRKLPQHPPRANRTTRPKNQMLPEEEKTTGKRNRALPAPLEYNGSPNKSTPP